MTNDLSLAGLLETVVFKPRFGPSSYRQSFNAILGVQATRSQQQAAISRTSMPTIPTRIANRRLRAFQVVCVHCFVGGRMISGC